MRLGALFAVVIGLFGAAGGQAFELPLPSNARPLSERVEAFGSYRLPIGPWSGEVVPQVKLEGQVSRKSFRLDGDPATTLQILAPIRDALTAQGYVEEFECRVMACGGFDFRFAIEVLPAPEMYVDLRDFRFLAARRGGDGVSILVSRSQNVAYVQVITVAASVPDDEQPASEPKPSESVSEGTTAFGEMLRGSGHIILDDLDFDAGDVSLNGGSYESISKLGNFLNENAATRVALVGHTDAVGSTERNLEVSRLRAEEVRDRLISGFGIDGSRIEAAGVGYWSPIASNLTAEGRNMNRRVEAVLLSID
jgi:OOP family OmpA-OmpF porin